MADWVMFVAGMATAGGAIAWALALAVVWWHCRRRSPIEDLAREVRRRGGLL